MAVKGGAARFNRILVDVSFEDGGMCRDLHDAVAVMFSDRGASQPAERAADMEDERSSGDCRELGSFLAMLSDPGASEPVERAADMVDEGRSRVSRELVSFFRELGKHWVLGGTCGTLKSTYFLNLMRMKCGSTGSCVGSCKSFDA